MKLHWEAPHDDADTSSTAVHSPPPQSTFDFASLQRSIQDLSIKVMEMQEKQDAMSHESRGDHQLIW
jgi:hypothetical protein